MTNLCALLSRCPGRFFGPVRRLGLLLLLAGPAAFANPPGGGTGTGPNVGLVDNGSTVTISNGIVAIVCVKSGATISQINYTYNNGGGTVTTPLLHNGTYGGELYWENSTSEGLAFSYSLVVNPATNGGSYAEIAMTSTSVSNDVLKVHYSMLRGSTGFYVTALYGHTSVNGAFTMGECRDNIYAGSLFNWMSVDAARNRLMEVSGGSSIGVQGAPVECYLWTNGIYSGRYEDKYKYSADLGMQTVWGWSSVGTGGANVGLWNVNASGEYYNGGPLKRELMEHIGTTILNMLNGGHYAMGSDGNFAAGEVWTKVCGPYFIYCNNVTNTLTATNAAAQALYADAQAQAVAEQGAWPYAWFADTNYAPAAQRGTVTGQLVIADSGNPNASAAGLWIGLVQQPTTTDNVYDFQQWMKPYQFWGKTGSNGSFALPNVIAGTNYTLYAFGPGAADTFLSQTQFGGNPPLLCDLPATPFAVTVTGGATNSLGTVTWKPTRVGATVFEIGYPDRTGRKFRHGDDYWVGDIGPNPSTPSPVWSKWLEYPFDFPNGPNYVVGQSRWTTDWNFIQPVMTDSQGNYNNTSSTITFNLATAPTNGAQASLYLGLASDYYAAIEVTVNGQNLGNVAGVTGTPNGSVPSTGYYTGYGGSDTSIREGINGAFSDERLTFPASLLTAGANTVNIAIRQSGTGYFADHAMYDYVRLELTGYVPPAPAWVAAAPGNGRNLVSWPAVPGATSYNVLRSTVAGSGYGIVSNGVVGPVCGCGSNNALWVDLTVTNGTTYYYVVRSVNPGGVSTNSLASAGVTPLATLATNPPAAPAGLTVSSSGHQTVNLSWTAAAGAASYNVWRSTLFNNGGGGSNVLSTIILNNGVTNTTYTDGSPTDGSIYSYFVTATGPGGTSTNSATVAAVPLPGVPAAPPASLTANFVATNEVTLNWTAVPGAVGYVIYRATSSAGPYMLLQSVTETTYADFGVHTPGTNFYEVVAMNAAGASANAINLVNSQQPAPASLTAIGTNTQVILSWTAATGATAYTLKRGTVSGGETNLVVTGYGGLSYTNTGLVNGRTYYYVVTATGTGGTSGNSPETAATPNAAGSGTWTSATGGGWSTVGDWNSGLIASGSGYTADFSTLSLPANATVLLDSARTISTLKFGDETATYNWTLAGTNPLTLGSNTIVFVANGTATLSVPVGGSSGLLKSGPGALALGSTAETVSNGVTVNGGTLTLDFSAAGSPVTNLLPAANGLTLSGGTLVVNGTNGLNGGQTFAGTAVSAGNNVITLAANGAAAWMATLGALSESPGATVEFVGPATTNGIASVAATGTNYTTTAGAGPGGILGNFGAGQNGAWATVGLYDWASTDLPNGTAGSAPYTVIGGSQVTGFYQTNGMTTAGNYDVNPAGLNSMGNTYGAATLRFNNSKAPTVTFTATTAQNIQGILVTPNMGTTNANLSGSGLEFVRSTSGGNCYGVVWQNNVKAWLNISAVLEGGRQAGQANGLVQAGPGTVLYTGSGGNNYELGTFLNGGCSVVNANADFGPSANASLLTLDGGTVVGNATFTLDNAGSNPRPVTLLGNGGGFAATAGTVLTVDGVIGSGTAAGPLVVGIPASAANGNVAGLLPGSGAGTANPTAVYATGTVTLTAANGYAGGTLLQSGTLNFNGINALGGGNYGGLTFNGGTLQYAAAFPGTNGSADLTSTGTGGVTLAGGGGTVDVNGNAITYAGPIGNNGNGALAVKSSLAGGSLTLAGANTYSGNTTVTNVVLVISNTTGSATGAGNVTVQNSANLTGVGTLLGSVNVNAGGLLSPGAPFGTLTLGGNLTLAGGSRTVVPVQHSPLTNAAVNVSGLLSSGGTLVVTNIGGPALAAGDTFKILPAGGYAGAFTNLTLPALGAGLFWSTSRLAVDGTLTVDSTNPPAVSGADYTGGQVVWHGTGGTPNAYFTVLTATNVVLPLAQWTAVATNQFDATGHFTCTNNPDPGSPQQFYILKEQ